MPNDVDLSNEIWARATSNPSDLTDIDQIGFVALDGMLKEGFMLGLKQEGTNSLDTIKRASKQGKLTYSAGIAALGPMAQKLLHSSEMSGLLSMAFGGRYLLTDNMSCLTVYIPGDQLGPHIDQPASDCAATAILYLDADSPDPDCERTGLQLNIYGEAPETINNPAISVIKTVPGRLVIGRGSEVWHERPPLCDGEWVMALTACFKAV